MATGLPFADAIIKLHTDSGELKLDLAKLEKDMGRSATQMEQSFFGGFKRGVGEAKDQMGSLAETVGSKVGKLSTVLASPVTAIAATTASFALFAESAIRDAISFENAWVRVRVMLQGTGEDADALKGKVLDITPSMASAEQEAGAFANVLATGFKSDEAVKLLDTAAKLSRVTGVDLNASTQLLTDTLHAYGLEVGDAAHVSDVLLGVMRQAGGPEAMGELQGALGRILPIAAELHMPFEQIGAALATMRTQGIPAGRAAMALGQILSKVTTEAQKFRDANIDIGRVAETEGIAGVIRAIQQVSGGTIEDMKDLGINMRTLQAVLSLSGDKAGIFADNLARMGQTKLDDVNKSLTGITQNTIDMKDAWGDFKISFGTLAIPPLAHLTRLAAITMQALTGQSKGKVVTTPADFPTWAEYGAPAEAGKPAAAEAGAAVEETGLLRNRLVAQTIKEEERLSNAQRARARENIEQMGQGNQAFLKLLQDSTLRRIGLEKQVAELHKASEEELLAFDLRTLDERERFEDAQRQNRLMAIERELPLLNKNIAEEKKLYVQLSEEKGRLEEQGVRDAANFERERTIVAEKAVQARLKLSDLEFQARKTKGKVSMQEEVDRLRSIGAGAPGRSQQERIQADAEAFKLAKQYADEMFQHERTLGTKSLQDEIGRIKQKVEAARQGSQERMKLEDDVFKKEEDLRNKRQNAALGMLGEAKTWLDERGYDTNYVTRTDVDKALTTVRMERGNRAFRAQSWAAGRGGMSMEDVMKGYQAAGSLNAENALQRELGSPEDILTGGAEVGKGPTVQSLGVTGDLIAGSYVDGMRTVKDAVRDAMSYIKEQSADANSFVAQNIFRNFEEWFVRKLQDQSARM